MTTLKHTLLFSLAFTIAGLVGAGLFVNANPDLFLEMMVIIGPVCAAAVAAAIVLGLGVIGRVALKSSWLCLVAAGPAFFLTLVLSFIWAVNNQHYIMEQWRLGMH
jgi:hypothetical protein